MNKSQPNGRSSESRVTSDTFWLKASEPSLAAIWDNPDDDVYAELLEGDDPEFTLNDLLAGVTKENQHPELDFGHPVGKEKL